MIYLLGGPPKCGKSTLAKKLSKKLSISWVSSDTLEVVAMHYVWKHAPEKFDVLYPHSASKGKTNDETYSKLLPRQVAKNYLHQGKATYAAIDQFSICQIKDDNDYIIEGYHVTPQLAAQLIKKYGPEHFRVLFLLKSNPEKIARDFQNSSTPNDWILAKTHHKETLPKIAEMIGACGKFFEKEAKKHGFRAVNVEDDFESQLEEAMMVLCN